MDDRFFFPPKVFQGLPAQLAHQSQTGHLTDLEDMLRTRLAAMAARGGVGEGRLAEGFQVLETG